MSEVFGKGMLLAPQNADGENVARISSLWLRDLINSARASAGEPSVRNDQFLARVEDELSDELQGVQKYYTPYHGNNVGTYSLTMEQCMLVGMRESKAVRRAVLEQLKQLERPQPVALPSYAEALRLYADQIEETQRVTVERDQAIATKAEIGSRREATAMATASQASKRAKRLEQELGRGALSATVIAVESALDYKFGKDGWRPLKKWCKENGVTVDKVPCPRYGQAASWPAGAWKECHGVDLATIFGGEA